MNTELLSKFPSQNANQFLEILTWALVGFGIVWLVTSVIGTMRRRAYNLTYAETGHSKKVQPDFLRVDKVKRDAAIARGDRYDDVLKRGGDARPDPVRSVSRWSSIGATLAALTGLLFTAVMTLKAAGPLDEGLRDLGNWEKLKLLVSQHQFGAVVCFAVIASNAYTVVQKLRRSE